MKKIAIIVISICLLSLNVYAANGLRWGVLNFKGVEETKHWIPVATFLTEKLGEPVKTIPIKLSGMVKRADDFDFLVANPVICIKIMDQFDFEPIATMKHKQLGAKFAGVIIVHKNSPITDLKQLAGKKVGVVHLKNAAGGFIFQAYELIKAGLVPERDFKKFAVISNQEAILIRTIKKQIDAGFIRTGTLESSKAKGIDISQVRILNKRTGDLKFPHSTDIYPHWGVLANKKLSKAKRDSIRSNLQSLSEVSPKTAVDAKIQGFAPPGDYSKLKTVMKELKVYDFRR